MNIWCISKQVINLFVDLLGELVDGGFRDIKLSVVALASWTGDRDILLGPLFVKPPWADVCGSVDFGHDGDAVFPGEVDEHFGLVESVELAVFESAGFSEFWVWGELEGKWLVIAQVPVQEVEFGQWHGLNKFSNSLNLEEMPGAVDHDASVNDERLIFDLPDLNLVTLDHLWEGFKSVDIAGICVGGNGDVRGLSGDWENVALLVGDFGWVDLDMDINY